MLTVRWRVGSGRAGFDHLDAEVANSVAQQVMEVLIASRFSEGGADDQVPDSVAAEVQGEEGVQLVPCPGRAVDGCTARAAYGGNAARAVSARVHRVGGS